jgi:hypothetical protein
VIKEKEMEMGRKALKETTYLVDEDILSLIQEWKWHTDNDGYITHNVRIEGKNQYHKMHRVVWEMHFGAIPSDVTIDHINGVRNDNRLSNLRLASVRKQGQNRKEHRNGNFLGVYHNKKYKHSFVAQIQVNGKHIYLGTFTTAEEAHNAYLQACKERGL